MSDRAKVSRSYVLGDSRGPWWQFRAYVAEMLIGLALTIDHRTTFGLAHALADLSSSPSHGES